MLGIVHILLGRGKGVLENHYANKTQGGGRPRPGCVVFLILIFFCSFRFSIKPLYCLKSANRYLFEKKSRKPLFYPKNHEISYRTYTQ